MEREPTGRRKRIPLGTPQPKLARPKRKGFVRRWINDIPGRIQRARQAGYKHVHVDGDERGEDKRGEVERAIVGVNPDGSAMEAFLMEEPGKYYEEDQAEKDKPLQEFDRVLRRGNIVGADEKDTERFYVPDQGISVKTGTET